MTVCLTGCAETSGDFAARLLDWYDQYGRHDLPWQKQVTPYRVWVSEIMLQQTRVGTVIPYFQRFMARFPEVHALASATQDEVLHYWSGLGYYARGRNLHRAAQQLVEQHQGQFPRERPALEALPGIGRSTAAAILALSRGQHEAILDGNVKRVLARHQAVQGWTGEAAVQKHLWMLAENLTPAQRVADYTQAIMDLGATVCTRSRPRCDACPVATDCLARAQGLQSSLPTPRPRREQPLRQVCMLIIQGPEGILLEQRPPTGLWGGLWGFPEVASMDDAAAWCQARLGVDPQECHAMEPFVHTFTHFRLHITPLRMWVQDPAAGVMEGAGRVWYKDTAQAGLGLAAPVARLLKQITQEDGETNGSHGEMRNAG